MVEYIVIREHAGDLAQAVCVWQFFHPPTRHGPYEVSNEGEEGGNESHESPPGRGYLLVAGIDPIQISPDGINPECHRLFLRILGRRLLMRASAHSTAWVSTMVLVVRTSAFCDTRFGWCSHTLALWRSAEAYESSSSPFGSFWSAFMFWRSAMTSCSQYPLFWDGISQAPSVPEVRVRPGATIPTQLTSVQLLMWRKRSTFLFASVSSEMPGLPLTSMHFSLIDDDEGFLVIQMAGSGLHRPAVLWMMFTFISCIDNDARANALRQAFVYFCQMILLFENCYVNTFFQLDLSHGSALFGHVAMVQGSWTPPKYHNVVACGPCFLCFSLIIAYTTRFLLLPAVEWYLPFSWCLCWRSYNDGDELASSSLGFSDLIVDLLRRRPAGQWSFDHWS